MQVEQIYTGCLSQASYLIVSKGEAVVIDPLRDVDKYIKLAEKNNSKIKYVIETHFHADFISGHLTLANLTGAKIIYGPNADPEFKAIIAKDNQIFNFGNVSLKTIHTPGHTLESTSFLLKDEKGKEHSIFTGDTLFLGDVGIPDVAQRYKGVSKEELAGILYDSVNERIKTLPEDILVYPGHGAGSACGKNMMKETVDTLKNQKQINYAINGSFTKEKFVKELTDNLPEPPSYFPYNVKLNQQGYEDLHDIITKSKKPLSVNDFESMVDEDDIIILDVRSQDEFASAHVPNSVFIGLDGGFAPWVGAILSNIDKPILLVSNEDRVEEAIIRLSRVGFDNVKGYLKGGVLSWQNAGKEIGKINNIKGNESYSFVERSCNSKNKTLILDVRNDIEFNKYRFKNVLHCELSNLDNIIKTQHKEQDILIHCAGGYRSMVAASILKKNNFENINNLKNGIDYIFYNYQDVPFLEG